MHNEDKKCVPQFAGGPLGLSLHGLLVKSALTEIQGCIRIFCDQKSSWKSGIVPLFLLKMS